MNAEIIHAFRFCLYNYVLECVCCYIFNIFFKKQFFPIIRNEFVCAGSSCQTNYSVRNILNWKNVVSSDSLYFMFQNFNQIPNR